MRSARSAGATSNQCPLVDTLADGEERPGPDGGHIAFDIYSDPLARGACRDHLMGAMPRLSKNWSVPFSRGRRFAALWTVLRARHLWRERAATSGGTPGSHRPSCRTNGWRRSASRRAVVVIID
jgi:hypothetical protein